MSWRKKLRKRIAEHQQKLVEERTKMHSDQSLIAYWEKEIRARQEALERLKKRLAG